MSDGADTIGGITTGALIAREVERARAGLPAAGHSEHEPCANCGTMRNGAYCHECGQVGHVHRNLLSLVHDLAHGVFHFEGKIWNTVPLLAWRPGQLTRRYIDGERAKFVSPMALFLFSVFLLFAIVPHLGTHGVAKGDNPHVKVISGDVTAAQVQVETYKSLIATMPTEQSRQKMQAKLAEAEARLAKAVQKQRAAIGNIAKTAPSPPAGQPAAAKPAADDEDGDVELDRTKLQQGAAKVDTGIPFVNYAIHHFAANPELTTYKLKTYAYKYSWALIPISVPFIWLLFCFRRDVGPYDHAIFAIYSLSFMSLAVVALGVLGWVGVPAALIALASIFVPPIHMYKQLKGTYRLGRFGAGWRTLALLCMTSITLSLFFAFLVYMGSD